MSKKTNLPRRELLCGFGAGLLAPLAAANEPVSSAIMDYDNAVLLDAHNEHLRRSPASLVKVMTLHLLFDALAGGDVMLADRLKISSFASDQPPVRLGLSSGEDFPVSMVAPALTVRSANDVAVALAEHIGGSEQRFCALMNARARIIGLHRTNFANASGLPSGDQRSTAADLVRLAVALRRSHERFLEYFALRHFEWSDQTYGVHTSIFDIFPGIMGAKTGYTFSAGYNLLVWADRGGRRLVGVVLGSDSSLSRDNLMAGLLDRAFSRL